MTFVMKDEISALAPRSMSKRPHVAGGVGIDTDSDSDSDPEAGSPAVGQPNKPLEPTPLNRCASRETFSARGSTPRR